MRFSSAGLVEQVLWDMRLADHPRGTNRALIDRLFNGLPPWTSREAEQARVGTNVNWLEGPRLAADARRSYYNAFLKPGNFFNVTVDGQPAFKNRTWGNIIQREWNKQLKASRPYFEFLRSQFALTVLHGIGPGMWMDRERWVPRCVGVEDVMIPSNTLLTMENLSYFGVFRQYTAMELYNMTHGYKVDPAWNMPLVEAALEWADQQTMAQQSYSEMYAPQKREDRWKQDLGFYGTDAVPTIDCWDFYFYSDEDDQQGWRRRMVLDTPASFEISGHAKMPAKTKIGSEHGKWLYKPEGNHPKKIYAAKLDEIMHFQFGDATATAPFRYHSVRSLGWLLWAVCHLQNRLRCKVNDAVFESMLQYFRASNPDDKERIFKVDLHDKGIVPEGIAFVTPQERWTVNAPLVELGLTQNRSMMDESAAQYREGREHGPTGKEKTATEIMAQVNAANALVGAMLMQAYEYHKFQGKEIARRFCISNSKDPDVRSFRANVLKAGVPENLLDSTRWNVEPERVLGSGNKTLEIAMADKLMAARQLYDPQSQREVLYLYTLANSDNPELAERLTSTQKDVSDSVVDAQLMLGTLMQGVPVPAHKGQNPTEMIETLLGGMAMILKPIMAGQAQPTPEKLAGLQNIGMTIDQYIQILAQDKEAGNKVKEYTANLGKLMNLLKKIGMDMQKQAQAGAEQGNGQMDPKDKAKIAATILTAKAKTKLAAESHAQRTQQRDIQFRMKTEQEAEKHATDLKKKLAETRIEERATNIKTLHEVRRNRLKALAEPAKPKNET